MRQQGESLQVGQGRVQVPLLQQAMQLAQNPTVSQRSLGLPYTNEEKKSACDCSGNEQLLGRTAPSVQAAFWGRPGALTQFLAVSSALPSARRTTASSTVLSLVLSSASTCCMVALVIELRSQSILRAGSAP